MWWFFTVAFAAEDGPAYRAASEAVRLAIARRTNHAVEDVEVHTLGLPETAPAAARWEVELPPDGPYCGSVPVRLQAHGDGVLFRYALRPDVTIWTLAPLARDGAAPGEPLSLVLGRVPLEDLRGEDPVDPEGSWEARVTLRAGDPVTRQRARVVPDARQGQNVTVMAARGDVVVETSGRLDQDAWVGQPVRVVNLANRTLLVGTYRAGGVVHLEQR